MLLLLATYIYRAQFSGIGDFGNYYYASVLWLNNAFSFDSYFPEVFNQSIHQITGNYTFLSFAPNSPFLAVLFAPLTLLPPLTAKLCFNVCSGALFLTTILRLKQLFKVPNTLLMVLPIVFFVPIKNQILFGQLYFVLLFLIVQWISAIKQERYWWAALYLSLAVAIKIFPLILIFPLLLQRKYKALLPMVITGSVLGGMCLVLLPFSVIECFALEVIPRSLSGQIAGLYVDNYQSWYMLLKRLLVFHSVENPTGLLVSENVFQGVLLAVKGVILAALWYLSKTNFSFQNTVAFWLVGAVLILDYGSTYLFLMWVPAVFYIHHISSFWHKVTIIGFLLVALNIPFTQFDFPFNYLRIILLTVGAIFLIYPHLVGPKLKLLSIVVGAFCIGWFKVSTPSVDEYATAFSMPILTTDYQISKSEITYHYYDVDSIRSNTFLWEVPILSIQELPIEGNQVQFNGKAITYSKSFKKKAYLLNQNQIIYLSDQNRGIGFYQLRKLTIEK